MATNGNRKGKAGERELAKAIVEAGYEARRSQQYCGVEGDGDLKHSIPGLHIECKRVERLNVLKAYEQAATEAGFKTPCVMHRCNQSPWLVTLSLSDFLALLRLDDDLDDASA